MYAKIFTILAAAGTMVSAAPLETRQEECAAYPWFIVPFSGSQDCTGDAAAYQPNSGPISSTPQNVYCQTLYDPNGAPASFGSVAVNRDPCPSQQWQINLYTDEGCTTQPTVVTSNVCVPAANESTTSYWTRFDAILLPPPQ